MLVIGLTGGIGSGKSTVGEIFSRLGVSIIDADQVSRDVVEPGQPALETIADHFGSSILKADGSLDRAALRSLVFAELREKSWLENLLHPLIRRKIEERIGQAGGPYCLLMSPLLLETSQRSLVHRILLVDAPESLQLERTVRRDNNDPSLVKAIMGAQLNRQQRRSQADDILVNDRDLEYLEREIQNLHQNYLQLAQGMA